jgi:hypothetical protein
MEKDRRVSCKDSEETRGGKIPPSPGVLQRKKESRQVCPGVVEEFRHRNRGKTFQSARRLFVCRESTVKDIFARS